MTEITIISGFLGAGKTTLLRDSIRALSNGEAYGIRLKVCVVDERSEIAASFHGVPQNDMGPRTDVMDGRGNAASDPFHVTADHCGG